MTEEPPDGSIAEEPAPPDPSQPAFDDEAELDLEAAQSDPLDELAKAATTGPARPEPELEWNPEWREFTWEDWVITSAALSTVIATQFIPPERERWRRTDPLFDEAGRRTLRLRDQTASLYARDASDVLVTTAIMYPVLVDALVVAWWQRQSPDVAREIALISAETLAVTSALQQTVSALVSRERPYGRRCGDDLSERTTYCKEKNRYRSFFSGHTSMSFAAAGVICSHHARIPLYGGGAGDQLACALGFVNAGLTGTFRVLADQHYVSDVVAGAAFGTLTGLALPYFLHYRPSARRGFSPRLTLHLAPVPGGVGLGGQF